MVQTPGLLQLEDLSASVAPLTTCAEASIGTDGTDLPTEVTAHLLGFSTPMQVATEITWREP